MPQKIKVACVCSAWLEIAGQSGDTVAARKRFIDDHRECREKLDAEIKSKINCDSSLQSRATMV